VTTIYHLKTCDSCRKIIKQFKAANIDFKAIDVRESPLSQQELSRFLEAFGWEALINRRSTTWRGLSENEKATAQDKALQLLQMHPALMKRPVIESSAGLTLGTKQADIDLHL